MIALPIIPNTHAGLVAEYIYTRQNEPVHEITLPVIAWDAEGHALVPGNRITNEEDGGRLVRAVEYAQHLRGSFDDAWRLFELSGPS